MGMAGPDTVLFVVGAVLFGGATYAIVALDGGGGSTSALGVFQVAFTTVDEELVREDVADLRSAEATFDVSETLASHLVSLTIAIECTDLPAGAAVPFTLQMSVAGPDGQTEEASGNCGSAVEVTIPVHDVPPDTVASGSTESEARANLEEALHGSAEPSPAVGTWTVSVSGARGGTGGAIPVGNPGGAIVVTAEEYRPQLTPIQR